MKTDTALCLRLLKRGPRTSAWIVAIALLFAFPCAIQAASPADAYESAPYLDNASATTLNVLPHAIEQSHTLHSPSDIDWSICIQTGEAGVQYPYYLRSNNITLAADQMIAVDLFEETDFTTPVKEWRLTWRDKDRYFTWLATGTKRSWCRVSSFLGGVEPAMPYQITFAKSTGASNCSAVAEGSRAIRVKWQIDQAPAGTKSFNVLRSPTGAAGSFTRINTTTLPPPNPMTGWMELLDNTSLAPGTVYYYQIKAIDAANKSTLFIPTFYGCTDPENPPKTSARRWALCECFSESTALGGDGVAGLPFVIDEGTSLQSNAGAQVTCPARLIEGITPTRVFAQLSPATDAATGPIATLPEIPFTRGSSSTWTWHATFSAPEANGDYHLALYASYPDGAEEKISDPVLIPLYVGEAGEAKQWMMYR